MGFLETYHSLCDMLKCGGLLIITPQGADGGAECAARTLIQFDGDVITSLNKARLHNDEIIEVHFDHVRQVLARLDKLNNYARRMLKSIGVLVPLWLGALILMEIISTRQIDVAALMSKLWPHVGGSGLGLAILGFGRSWVFQGIVALGRFRFEQWSESQQFPDEPTQLF